MSQYKELKSKYDDAILLFRVGDFYETFSEDAITASKILGIVLTARNNGSSKVELAGFPHHSLDSYVPKLVQAGHRVAVCEQLEKPSKLKKIVKRGVTEIVTPGITVNDKILDHKKNNFLATLHWGAKKTIGIAFLDISTGEFLISEGPGHYIQKLLQSFQPREIVHARNAQKNLLEQISDNFYTYAIDDWVFTEDYCYDKLTQQFEVNSLKGFGIEELANGQIAAGAALHYIATTENRNLKHLTSISRIQAEQHVWMDKFTVRNLELIQASQATGTCLFDILDHTLSPMGARMLKKWILLPLTDLELIHRRQDIVEVFYKDASLLTFVGDKIKQIGDLERLISKVPLGKINPREIKQIEKALELLLPIKEILSKNSNKALSRLADQLNLCLDIKERIHLVIQEDPPVKLEKGNCIQNGVSKELDELKDIILNSKDHLLNLQLKEAQATGIENLKIGFNNVFGYYLEVTNKYKDKGLVPDHWIRKQTLTNAERYITEDLKVLETKILNAESKILEQEQQIYDDLVQEICNYILPIQKNAGLIAQLDCLSALADVALANNYHKPEINDTFCIDIKDGRHPVIEKQLGLEQDYIPNDIFLDNDSQQIIMITGPNMSGKSAILRQSALIVLMAQMGAFVPASSAKIGLVDKIFTRVGASDNISSGESTFMVEMNETASILNNVSERSLILLDEIGRGTSTYDGISIAWSIAEFLHNNGIAHPKTLFATHYHELNNLATRYERIKNFNVSTKEINNKVIFIRKLVEGGSKHSFGIHVAKMAGMPGFVVERSHEILLQLEQKSIDDGDLAEKIQHTSTPVQLSFFDQSTDPKLLELKSILEEMDLNRLTPLDCMLKLVELKKMIE